MRRRRRPAPRRRPAARLVPTNGLRRTQRPSFRVKWWPLTLEIGVLAAAIWAMRWAVLAVYLHVYRTQMPNGDVAEYRQYALNFWQAQPLFHRLPVEYPPLAIAPFTLTLLPPLPDVYAVFAWWAGVILVVGYLWIRRYAGRARAITYAVYLILAGMATVVERYDLVPALTTLLALRATQRRRFGHAYLWLAAGVLLKLYPAFLVPLVAVEQWWVVRTERLRARPLAPGASPVPRLRAGSLREWIATLADEARQPEATAAARGLGLCGGVVALGFGVAWLLSPVGAISGFTYATSRPLQIESTPASLLWLGAFLGFPAHAVYTFQSLNLVGPLEVVFEPLALAALGAGCLYVYWRLARRLLTVDHAFVACLCIVIVANKIFSPQYLIWILPLVAYVEGFEAIWLAICLLTAFIFPVLYFSYRHILLVPTDWRFLPAVALRNALLLVVTVRAIWGAPRPTVPRGSPSRRYLSWLGAAAAGRPAEATRTPASIGRS